MHMHETDTQAHDLMEVVVLRANILCALHEDGELTLGDLDRMLDDSRRSLSRWLSELTEDDLVMRADEGYELTFSGETVTNLYLEHRELFEPLAEADDLLARLPTGTNIGCAMLDGVEIAIEPKEAPESAWRPVDRAVGQGESVVGIAPRVTPSYIDTFYTQIVEQDTEVELLLPPQVYASIVANYEYEWRSAILEEDSWFGAVESVPPYGMLIIDESEVWVGVYRSDEGAALAGTLHNDSDDAAQWALEVYECHRDRANDVLGLS